MEDKKKRSTKTTRQQYAIYLEELEANSLIKTNKFEPAHPELLDQSWDLLTLKLNSCGGPTRTTSQWKRVFTDWKCQVRKKARNLKLDREATGGGTPSEKPLTDLEIKLIELTGKVAVYGMLDVEEIGLAQPAAPQNVISTTSQDAIPTISQDAIPTTSQDIVMLTVKLPPAGETSLNKNIAPQIESSKEKKLKKKEKKKSNILDQVQSIISEQDQSLAVLKEINKNLKKLVTLKTEEHKISKLKLKYNIDFTDSSESDE